MGGTSGALGQSSTADDCNPNDEACLASGLDAPLAVGASVRPRIKLDVQGSGAMDVDLVSTQPGVATAAGGVLTGHSPGIAAILMRMPDGTVVDFVHIWVAAPTRIELVRMSPEGADRGTLSGDIGLVVGENIHLESRIYGEARELTGYADTRWRVDPPLVDVIGDGTEKGRRIIARFAGRAKLTVESAGRVAETNVVVVEP